MDRPAYWRALSNQSGLQAACLIQQRDAERARDLMQAHAELTVQGWAAIYSNGLGIERAWR